MTKSKKSAKASEQQQAVTPQEYSQFISGIQLRNIELAQMQANAEQSKLSELTLKVGTQFGVSCSEQSDQGFTVEAKLALDFTSEEGDALGQFSCIYRLIYTTTIPLTDAIFVEFSRRNVPLNVWPFLRELVMSTTQRFGWSGFVLPAYKVPSLAHPSSSKPASKEPTKKRAARTKSDG